METLGGLRRKQAKWIADCRRWRRHTKRCSSRFNGSFRGSAAGFGSGATRDRDAAVSRRMHSYLRNFKRFMEEPPRGKLENPPPRARLGAIRLATDLLAVPFSSLQTCRQTLEGHFGTTHAPPHPG